MEIKEKKRTKKLTEREIIILKHIAAGYSDMEIAGTVKLSYGTVRKIIEDILKKADVTNRVTLVAWGFRNNYLK